MTTWTDEELSRIGEAHELQLASERPDGTMRPFVTMWVVRAAEDLYVRSAYGPDSAWYRRAKTTGVGRIRAGGLVRDVTFDEPGSNVHPDIDAAYHAKYDRYGTKLVGTVVGPEAATVTIKLVPRSSASWFETGIRRCEDQTPIENTAITETLIDSKTTQKTSRPCSL